MIRKLTILLLISGKLFCQNNVSIIENKKIICLNINDTISAVWNHRLNNTVSQTVNIGKKIMEI